MSVSGADIVSMAANELGDPYVFGAEGPNSFDCSGLVEYVFKKFGIKTPRIAADQAHFGTAVPRAKIQAGDLIFFNWGGGSRAEHVGIYAGNNQMIHAPHTGTVVKKVKLGDSYWANAIAVRRFPGVTGGPVDNSAALGKAGEIVGQLADNIKSSNGGLTGALANIAAGIGEMASSALSVGKVAESVLKLFLPTTLMRAAAGLMGAVFLLLGIFFLTREARAA